MAQRRSRDHWYVDLRSGETRPYAVIAGQRVWVTHAKLVDPATVAAGQTVRVALRTMTGDDESIVLSAERPVAPVRSAEILEDEFWLERDEDHCADAIVRFRGRSVNLLAPETVDDEDGDEESDVEEEDDWEGVGIEDGVDMVEGHEATGEEMRNDGDGIDDEEEESDYSEDPAVRYLEGHVSVLAPPETDTEQDREDQDAVLQEEEEEEEDDAEAPGSWSTAGCLRIFTDEDEESQGGGNNDRQPQILVLYRYTIFSAASFDGSVEARGSTIEHQLRFIADGGFGARSLAWAGASLVRLIYPRQCSDVLRGLWSRLIADLSIPPHATRVELLVDVGILPPADCTPANMRKANIREMCATLEDMIREHPWSEGLTCMELHQPEPVRCGHDNGEERLGKRKRTTGEERLGKKRSRVVSAGETCTICLELLEGDDLAAWPGCSKPHVFHGRCLELVLETNATCPICRRKLFTEIEL